MYSILLYILVYYIVLMFILFIRTIIHYCYLTIPLIPTLQTLVRLLPLSEVQYDNKADIDPQTYETQVGFITFSLVLSWVFYVLCTVSYWVYFVLYYALLGFIACSARFLVFKCIYRNYIFVLKLTTIQYLHYHYYILLTITNYLYIFPVGTENEVARSGGLRLLQGAEERSRESACVLQ